MQQETITFAAPVRLDGKRGNMAVVVKVSDKKRYKMHRVLTLDGKTFVLESKKTEVAPDGGVTNNGSLATSTTSVSNRSISQNATRKSIIDSVNLHYHCYQIL